MKLISLDQLSLLLFTCLLVASLRLNSSEANQIESLNKLLEARRSQNPPLNDPWHVGVDKADDGVPFSPVYIGNQEGLKEDDKISALPGQPESVDFDQYGGYVTVNPQAGRALFYYFAESAENSSSKPLVLWLNGGPGCTSLGYGAMEELGPFRVNTDGETLSLNPSAWNNVANVLFLESPAGVGFSYSNTTSDYSTVGDKRTAEDSYAFLINWLERFPEYKTRDFYITGESYAGHYVPQLAYTILAKNKVTNQTVINLKGIAIGNAWIDDETSYQGMVDYFWTHALLSDEIIAGIHKYCDFLNISITCEQYLDQVDLGMLDIYNIYAPLCKSSSLTKKPSTSSVYYFDPCTDDYVYNYLNLKDVQAALHAKPTQWDFCRDFPWADSPTTILPIIEDLITNGLRVWIYSGDTDGRVPVTSSRYSVNTYNLTIVDPWHPWYYSQEVGGYAVEYKGLVLTTVRGAGHMVPSYQPERALTMFSSFLQGQLPPSEP